MKKDIVSEDDLKKSIIQYSEKELEALPPKENLTNEITPESEAKIQELIDSISYKLEE